MTAILKEKVEHLETRTDSLETVLGQFISSMNLVMGHMQRDTEEFKRQTRADTEAFKRQSRADTEAFKRQSRADTEAFKKEVRADTEAFKKEVSGKMEELSGKMGKLSEKIEEVSMKMERETKRFKRSVGKEMEKLSKKMGTLVEDMVAPNMPDIAKRYFNDPRLEFLGVRIKKRRADGSAEREFDVIAISETRFYVSETKSKPRPEDVREFLDALAELGEYFPESADRRVIPIYSTLHIPENIWRHLTRNGIYAMGLREGTMDLLNFEEVEKALSRAIPEG